MPSMSLEEHEHNYALVCYSIDLNLLKRNALWSIDGNISTVGGRIMHQGDIVVWTHLNDPCVNLRRFTGDKGNNNHLPYLDPLRIQRKRIPEIAENIAIFIDKSDGLMRPWVMGTIDVFQD